MAASIVVPARRRRQVRLVSAAAAAARTAPRGAGLAPVVPLPVRGSAVPVDLPARTPVAAPQLVAVPSPRRRDVAARRRLVAVLVATMLIALGLATVVGGASDRGEPVAAGHVVLQPGETLWDVAVRSAPIGVDPRRQLDTLRRLNGFGPGPLEAWTVVLIPAM